MMVSDRWLLMVVVNTDRGLMAPVVISGSKACRGEKPKVVGSGGFV